MDHAVGRGCCVRNAYRGNVPPPVKLNTQVPSRSVALGLGLGLVKLSTFEVVGADVEMHERCRPRDAPLKLRDEPVAVHTEVREAGHHAQHIAREGTGEAVRIGDDLDRMRRGR